MSSALPHINHEGITLTGTAAKGSDQRLTHIAIIMDGNGRWAALRGAPRIEGHRAGTANIRRVVRSFASLGLPYLTLFAFSTENWERPDPEVNGLMAILRDVIEDETRVLHGSGVRICHLGTLDGLPQDLRQAIENSVELTRWNTGLTLGVAFNYGGRAEILRAVRQMLSDGVTPEHVTPELFSEYLFTYGIPDVDLVIRTGGEMRISNFMLWQAAYAEYYSTPVQWPDFDEAEIERALAAYSGRHRRFGIIATEA